MIEDLQALRVAPDEVLILRVDKGHDQLLEDLSEALDEVGLTGRSLIIVGDVEFAVAAKPDVGKS